MSNLYPIIGLAGKQASGKTTASDFLAKTYNGASIALADPIKRYLFQLGASEEALWGASQLRSAPSDLCITDEHNLNNQAHELCEILGLTPADSSNLVLITKILSHANIRDCLKVVGTDWGRGNYNDVWIRYGLKLSNTLLTKPFKYEPVHGIQSTSYPNDYVIINDLRFRDEILAVKAKGGAVFRMKTKGNNNDSHISETELDSVPDHWFDDVIYNNKDGIENLQKHISWVMNRHYKDDRGLNFFDL